MTYNVHRCVGHDAALDPARVAAVIARYEPDVVALQELDVGRARTAYGDQPDLLAKILKMEYHFHPSFLIEEERYGNAVLSRLPLTLVKAGPLPSLPPPLQLETRGALWVTVACAGRAVQLINTHLGLRAQERLVQVEALLGPGWLGDPRCRAPRLLVGDLNAWPGTAAFRRVRQTLIDAQECSGLAWPRFTFPARLPVMRIDHVFVSAGLTVHGVQVPRTRLTRIASDHLPLIVDLEVT